MECYCYVRHAQDLLADGKTPSERRFGGPFKGPVIIFGAMVEYYPICSRGQLRLHQFDQKVLPGIFIGHALIVGGIWKGDILFAAGKDGRIRSPPSKNPWGRSINATQVRRIHFPTCRWYSKIVRTRSRIPRTHSKAASTCFERRPQRRTSRRIGKIFQPTEANSKIMSEPSGIGKPLRGAESNVEQDGVEALIDFWPIQGDFIYRHHIVFYYS